MKSRRRISHRPRLIGARCALLAIFFASDPAQALIRLDIDSNSASIPILITDYNFSTGAATKTVTGVQTLTVRSNKQNWTLSVRALSNTFSFAPSLGDPDPNKPASDLAVRAPTETNVFVPLTTSDQVLGDGPKSTQRVDVPLDYRLQSNLATDPPGTYSISIIYTVVEN